MSIDSTKRKLKRTPYYPIISLTEEDFEGIDKNLDDPIIILVVAANFLVKKVLMDQGISADLLYLPTLRKIGIPKKELRPFDRNLIGFFGEQVSIKGYIDLLTLFGIAPLVKTIHIRHLVIDFWTPYNMLLDRTSLNNLGVVVSTPHLTMKFPVSDTKVETVHAD